jgi:putative DNA primase/helicase
LDVKADGYVVAAPSVHPDTGKAYAWDGRDVAIADAPAHVIELAQGGQRIKPATSPSSNVIAKGGRNSAMCSLAGVSALRAWREALRVALLAENEVRCNPPLDPAEVERIARSVARYAPESRHPETDVGNARRLVDTLNGSSAVRPCEPSMVHV